MCKLSIHSRNDSQWSDESTWNVAKVQIRKCRTRWSGSGGERSGLPPSPTCGMRMMGGEVPTSRRVRTAYAPLAACRQRGRRASTSRGCNTCVITTHGATSVRRHYDLRNPRVVLKLMITKRRRIWRLRRWAASVETPGIRWRYVTLFVRWRLAKPAVRARVRFFSKFQWPLDLKRSYTFSSHVSQGTLACV